MIPIILLTIFSSFTYTSSLSTTNSTTIPHDAIALLTFQKKADINNKLHYPSSEYHCKWQGVECTQTGKVVSYHVQGLNLHGFFAQNTLTRLDKLQTLNLSNNTLFGPIPDLSQLINLESLFLDHNNFSGSFPLSVVFLHRLVSLKLNNNNLTGSLPVRLTLLDRLMSLHLESNHFSGLLPPLNQKNLRTFDVSANNLTGPVPLTVTLSWFKPASFSENPGLCGKIVQRQCDHHHHHRSVWFTVIVILVIVFTAMVVIIVVIGRRRKLVASGFAVLKQQMEMEMETVH